MSEGGQKDQFGPEGRPEQPETFGGAAIVAPDEPALLAAVRSGSSAAFGVLYEHHRPHVMRYARRVLRDDPALSEDVVEVAFARTFQALRNGKGPSDTMRFYLMASIRNEVMRLRRKASRDAVAADRWVAGERTDATNGAPAAQDVLLDGTTSELMSEAMRQIPARWRHVLWLTEVEGREAAEVAPLLSLTPNSAAALAYRARQGLRTAYLEAYGRTVASAECRAMVPALARTKPGQSSSGGASDEVEAHLLTCASCRDVMRGVDEPGAALRSLAPFGVLSAGWWARNQIVETPRTRAAFWRWGAVAAVAAVIVIAIVAGVRLDGAPDAERATGTGSPSSTTTSKPKRDEAPGVSTATASGLRPASTTVPEGGPPGPGPVTTTSPVPNPTDPTPGPGPASQPSASTTLPPAETRGSVSGQIDAQGVGFGGVPVDLTSEATGQQVRVFSSRDGSWQARLLPAGPYQVTSVIPLGYVVEGSADPSGAGGALRSVDLGTVTVGAGADSRVAPLDLQPRRELVVGAPPAPVGPLGAGDTARWPFQLSSTPVAAAGVTATVTVRIPAGASVSVAVSGVAGCAPPTVQPGTVTVVCRVGRVGPSASTVAVSTTLGRAAPGSLSVSVAASAPNGLATSSSAAAPAVRLRPD